ncbi:MAG: septum formation initiator [Rikenellaceae bacterium]
MAKKKQVREQIFIVITVVIMAPILIVIAKNLYHSFEIWREISELNGETEIYQESITRDSLLLEKIKSDEGLEKYARETFFMQRSGERVFIIE